MTKQQAVKRAILAFNTMPARLSSRRDTLTQMPAQQPIIFEENIRIRAYQLWESAGRPDGQDRQLWLQAEKELRQAAH
jgi:hypothetical protein